MFDLLTSPKNWVSYTIHTFQAYFAWILIVTGLLCVQGKILQIHQLIFYTYRVGAQKMHLIKMQSAKFKAKLISSPRQVVHWYIITEPFESLLVHAVVSRCVTQARLCEVFGGGEEGNKAPYLNLMKCRFKCDYNWLVSATVKELL